MRRVSVDSILRRRLLLGGIGCIAIPGIGMAQSNVSLSQKPITLVVPFAPGGGSDSIARELGKYLSAKMGVPVVVDNRAGAGGAIAATSIAKAAPDGASLLFTTSTFVTHAASDPTPTYNPSKDFAPVAMLGRGPLLVVTSKASGLRSIQELLSAAKSKPGALTFCSAGPGSINHLAGEYFSQMAGIEMTHVPYKGSGPATLDFLAGRTQVFFATVPTIRAHVRDDKVNLLAVTSATRAPMYPDTPTVMESGLPKYEVSTWWGVSAPAGTPSNVIAALNQAINEVSPQIKDRFVNEGATLVSESPAFFGEMIASELTAWSQVMRR
ncbi:MAG: tripartite tricarboxylate transporter substrate binding protein [Betaproteobacteria bacterium]